MKTYNCNVATEWLRRDREDLRVKQPLCCIIQYHTMMQSNNIVMKRVIRWNILWQDTRKKIYIKRKSTNRHVTKKKYKQARDTANNVYHQWIELI